MGAWGMGLFDDDTSRDLLCDAMKIDAQAFIKNAARHRESDYLEYTESHEVIVSAVIIDSLCNGTNYDHGEEGYDEWLAHQSIESIISFKNDITIGLRLVLSNNSELYQLWQEIPKVFQYGSPILRN